jgi:pyruvate,orthophosphate dikinase
MNGLVALDGAEARAAEQAVGRVGHKGAGLAQALRLGCTVPPAIAIPADAWGQTRVDRDALREALAVLERWTGLTLDGPRPLCVALRPSPVTPRPGALPTVLDAGATRQALDGLAARLGGRAEALDCRARFLRGVFRARGGGAPSVRGMRGGGRPSPEALEREVDELEARLALEPGASALDEIAKGLDAVRAAAAGEAVILQAMVYGSSARGISGAGTASSRHPIHGDRVVFGELAWQAQGEDLSLGRGGGVALRAAAAGRRADESLERRAPQIFATLDALLRSLEQALDAVVDVEFAIEDGVLHVLQLRPSVLTPRAEIRVAVDWVTEGRLDRATALARVPVASLAKVGRVELLDEPALSRAGCGVIGRGLAASPGAATGHVAIDVEDALRRAAAGEPVVLVRSDASPEDAPAVRAAVGVATASGGLTSHAAVMSRALGRPCVVSVSNLRVYADHVRADLGGGRSVRLSPGDLVSVDGAKGWLVSGAAPTRWVAEDDAPRELARWARAASSRIVLVPAVLGAEPVGRAEALEADGVWDGHTATDLSGRPRPEWDAPQPWDGPERPWPPDGVVVVPPGLVAAARLAATRG